MKDPVHLSTSRVTDASHYSLQKSDWELAKCPLAGAFGLRKGYGSVVKHLLIICNSKFQGQSSASPASQRWRERQKESNIVLKGPPFRRRMSPEFCHSLWSFTSPVIWEPLTGDSRLHLRHSVYPRRQVKSPVSNWGLIPLRSFHITWHLRTFNWRYWGRKSMGPCMWRWCCTAELWPFPCTYEAVLSLGGPSKAVLSPVIFSSSPEPHHLSPKSL